MKKSRYTDEQIVRILQESDQGKLCEVAKRYGVSEASIYVWRKRYYSLTESLKQRDLEKALEELGWYFLRHGGNHDRWTNGKETEIGLIFRRE